MATTSPNDMLQMRAEGYRDGFSDGVISVLDWLEAEYLSDGLKDPKSAKGRAILQLAGDLAAEMRKPEFGAGRRSYSEETATKAQDSAVSLEGSKNG